MENPRAGRRPRRSREPRFAGLSLLDRPPIRNSFAPIAVMSQDQLEAIHEASLRLLEEIGIEFMGAAARQAFRQAGAAGAVDRAVELRADPAQSVPAPSCRRQPRVVRPGRRAAECP